MNQVYIHDKILRFSILSLHSSWERLRPLGMDRAKNLFTYLKCLQTFLPRCFISFLFHPGLSTFSVWLKNQWDYRSDLFHRSLERRKKSDKKMKPQKWCSEQYSSKVSLFGISLSLRSTKLRFIGFFFLSFSHMHGFIATWVNMFQIHPRVLSLQFLGLGFSSRCHLLCDTLSTSVHTVCTWDYIAGRQAGR